MLSTHPAHPRYPVGPEPLAEGSDQRLTSSLRTPSWATDPYPLAALLGRHWQPVYDYATLCATPDGGAGALAAAAVHQVFRSLERSGPVAALRPRLLTAVRDTAEAWATGPRARPGPLPAAAERGPTAPLTGEVAPGAAPPTGLAPSHGGDRRLALRSFTSLPPRAQCLLWHTAVEAEPVSVPAALLALDIGSALTELESAREQFRSGLLHAHTELVAHAACRFYGRLLDAQSRRGRTLLPDVQHHLLVCPSCAAVAVQLGLFERRPGLLLAQAVLGGPAEDYLASRPGRRPAGGGACATREAAPQASTSRDGRGRRPGRHRLVPKVPVSDSVPSARVCARALLTGTGLASAVALGAVLGAVLAAALWPSGPTGAGVTVPGGVDSPRTKAGAPDAEVAPEAMPLHPTSAVFGPGSRPVAGLAPVDQRPPAPCEESRRAVLHSEPG